MMLLMQPGQLSNALYVSMGMTGRRGYASWRGGLALYSSNRRDCQGWLLLLLLMLLLLLLMSGDAQRIFSFRGL